ncbi:MAG: fibronectin type III domain-containing protein [Alistipes sp.]|nr:fibronectin type III domain-containing protein [Alistipes sp.]
MKKLMFMFAAMATMAFAACGSDDNGGNEPGGKQRLATPAPKAEEVTETSFKVAWAAVANADKYVFTVNNGAETTIASTSYTVPDLSANTPYTFKVKAVSADTDKYTESAWGEVKVTTKESEGPIVGPGDVPECLKGNSYLLVVLGEGTKEMIPAENIAADWRTNDYTCFNYVWNGYYGNEAAAGPNSCGVFEGWTALVTDGGWAGGGYCCGVIPADNAADGNAVLAQMNEWLPKTTSEEGWYLHFAMKSPEGDNLVHAIRLYPIGGDAVELKIGVPGDGNEFSYTRDGDWHEFDVPMSSLVAKGCVFRNGDYTKGENVVGYGAVADPVPAGKELNLDAVFFYKK